MPFNHFIYRQKFSAVTNKKSLAYLQASILVQSCLQHIAFTGGNERS